MKKRSIGRHLEFKLELKRPFKPSDERKTPLFWVEEFRVYRSFDPKTKQCEYTLRPGLNILWANPGPGKKALYEKGVRGHAAGKTTFCRFLRYILGEQNYGTSAFKQSLLGTFPTAILTAKVWLDDKPWVICKSFGLMEKRDMAFQGESIEQVFSPPAITIKSSEFSDMLGELVTKPLTARSLPYGSRLTWRYVLPWLSRDQECRLAHLLEWRDPSTESNRPDMTISDACYIVRSVMGLISKDEEDAQAEHRKLLNTSKDLETKVPLLKHEAAQALKKVQQWAAGSTVEGPLLFGVVRKALESERDQVNRDSRLQTAKGDYEKLRGAFEKKNNEVVSAEQTYEQDRRLLEIDKQELQTLRGGSHNEMAKEQMDGEAPAPSGRCNVLLSVAISKGCRLAKGKRPDFESQKNLMTLSDEIEALENGINMEERRLNESKAEIGALRGQLAVIRGNLDRAEHDYDVVRTQLSERRGVLLQQLVEVAGAEQLYADALAISDEQTQTQQNLTESLRTQEDIRKRADEKRDRVNSLFDDLIKAVLGDDVNASFTAHAQSIDLKVECDGERTSAATETVKILAFDLAAMLLSAEGFGHHPRFLIHDSPREADMANDIYQRFFMYMETLERAYGGRTPNFQYIVTTTEPPPSDLRHKPWLIDKLDASKAEGRLLRVNL